jgi:uncharacterized protein
MSSFISAASSRTLVAFDRQSCVASGPSAAVVQKLKTLVDAGNCQSLLVFDAETSELVEIDFRGTPQEVLSRLDPPGDPLPLGSDPSAKRGPGRPKLGVVGREVTLLPRHWEWLDLQPGGASVALRKLVETAKRSNQTQDRARQAQDSVYRFMSTMAGDLPGFEEALRAFYAKRPVEVRRIVAAWPEDIREHIGTLLDKVQAASGE